jgi:hypothetical protein
VRWSFFCFNLKKGVLAGAVATIVLLVLTLTIIVCWRRAKAEANAGEAAKPPPWQVEVWF